MSRRGRRERDQEITSGDKALVIGLLKEYKALLEPDADLTVLVTPGTKPETLDFAIHIMMIA